MRTMNKDYESRNEIIFGGKDTDSESWLGGTRNFESLDLEQLQALIRNNFINLEECQNCSPSVSDFLDFMKKYPAVEAHGYAVSHKRDDYRVSLEGIRFDGNVTMDMLLDFVHLCRHADEFSAVHDHLWAWWD